MFILKRSIFRVLVAQARCHVSFLHAIHSHHLAQLHQRKPPRLQTAALCGTSGA